MVNRRRNHKVSLYLDDKEKKLFLQRVYKVGMTQQEYLRLFALNGKIIVIPGLKEMIFEIRKQGVNLNQLARNSNEGYPIATAELKEVKKEYLKLCQYLKQLHQKEM